MLKLKRRTAGSYKKRKDLRYADGFDSTLERACRVTARLEPLAFKMGKEPLMPKGVLVLTPECSSENQLGRREGSQSPGICRY